MFRICFYFFVQFSVYSSLKSTNLKKGLFIILTILIASCSTDEGSRVVGDNLSVYYTSEWNESFAEKIAVYWKDNDLISGEKQDMKLIEYKNSYQLCIIANQTDSIETLPFEERKLLLELQKDLQETVFNKEEGGMPVEIVLCNNKFETIYTIN